MVLVDWAGEPVDWVRVSVDWAPVLAGTMVSGVGLRALIVVRASVD